MIYYEYFIVEILRLARNPPTHTHTLRLATARLYALASNEGKRQGTQ